MRRLWTRSSKKAAVGLTEAGVDRLFDSAPVTHRLLAASYAFWLTLRSQPWKQKLLLIAGEAPVFSSQRSQCPSPFTVPERPDDILDTANETTLCLQLTAIAMFTCSRLSDQNYMTIYISSGLGLGDMQKIYCYRNLLR